MSLHPVFSHPTHAAVPVIDPQLDHNSWVRFAGVWRQRASLSAEEKRKLEDMERVEQETAVAVVHNVTAMQNLATRDVIPIQRQDLQTPIRALEPELEPGAIVRQDLETLRTGGALWHRVEGQWVQRVSVGRARSQSTSEMKTYTNPTTASYISVAALEGLHLSAGLAIDSEHFPYSCSVVRVLMQRYYAKASGQVQSLFVKLIALAVRNCVCDRVLLRTRSARALVTAFIAVLQQMTIEPLQESRIVKQSHERIKDCEGHLQRLHDLQEAALISEEKIKGKGRAGISLEDLPDEILRIIIAYTDVRDIGNIAQVSRRMRDVASDEMTYEAMFRAHVPESMAQDYLPSGLGIPPLKVAPGLSTLQPQWRANYIWLAVSCLITGGLDVCETCRNIVWAHEHCQVIEASTLDVAAQQRVHRRTRLSPRAVCEALIVLARY